MIIFYFRYTCISIFENEESPSIVPLKLFDKTDSMLTGDNYCIVWSNKNDTKENRCSQVLCLYNNNEPYKSDDISCKNTFSVKKVWPSKVESYLEVNVGTDW